MNYSYINKEYNININEEKDKEKFCKKLELYISYRKMIIILLQKMLKIFDFNDLIFYQCLFYMDYIFSHQIKEEMKEKDIINYLIGYFLISSKLIESDMTEPPLESFMDIKENIIFSKRKIAYYEILCLKSINYNIFSYSAYDWIVHLINIGIIFNCEIDNKNSIILMNGHRHTIVTSINKYAFKLLLNLITKNLFIKYSPIYIAFGVIQISREKFLDENLINRNLFNKLINLYGISFDDYKKCYEELKLNIPCDKINKNEKNTKEDIPSNNESNKDKINLKIIKKNSLDNSLTPTLKKLNKGFPININKNLNELFSQEQKNSLDKNNLKMKKAINGQNLNNDNSNEFSGKNADIFGIFNEEEKQIIKQKKIDSQKNFNYSINYKENSFKRNDNLPLVIPNLKLNINQNKQNFTKKNFSKSIFNRNHYTIYKLEYSKEKFQRKSTFNIYNSKTKINKKNIPHGINLIKKSLFKEKNSYSKIKKLSQIKNNNNLSSTNNIIGNKKILNNISSSKKNYSNIIKFNNEHKYHLGNKRKNSSFHNYSNHKNFIYK